MDVAITPRAEPARAHYVVLDLRHGTVRIDVDYFTDGYVPPTIRAGLVRRWSVPALPPGSGGRAPRRAHAARADVRRGVRASHRRRALVGRAGRRGRGGRDGDRATLRGGGAVRADDLLAAQRLLEDLATEPAAWTACDDGPAMIRALRWSLGVDVERVRRIATWAALL